MLQGDSVALFIPDALKLLLIHDRQEVKFFPYRENDNISIDCIFIVQDYNEKNRPENAAANIKLFSIDQATTVHGILDQPGMIIFSDNEVFYFSGVNTIAIENNQVSVSVKKTTAKAQNSTIQNVNEYNDFEFNLINLADYEPEEEPAGIFGWKVFPEPGPEPTTTGIFGFDELEEN